MGSGSTPVIQVTNVAPTVTNEQLRTLFAFVGTIREFTVYPSNDPSQQMSRVCYVKFLDPTSVSVAQHLTNTVFIDRAIFVKPVSDGKIPDEILALKLANEGHSQNSSNSGVFSQVATVNGTQSITTIDPRLNALGLPQYPPLPANLDPSKIEEIRRTIAVTNISQYTSPEDILEFFNQFGEVKYLRLTSNDGDIIKSVLIEFTDQSSVANALQNTGTTLNGLQLNINHSTASILKPQHNLTDAEKFYESRELKRRSKDSKSPVRSRRDRSPRRSRSPHRSRRRSVSRSRSHERRRISRSKERRRTPERRRSRSRSYSKGRIREKSRRDRSKDHDRHRSRDRSIERDRSRKSRDERDRRREHSREHRSKDRDRERSSRTRDHRSRDSDRKERHRSKRDKERRRSRSKSKNVNDKKESTELPLESVKSEEMEISRDKKNELDNSSAKSDEGSASLKSFSSRRSSSQSRSHGIKKDKLERLYDSEDEKY